MSDFQYLVIAIVILAIGMAVFNKLSALAGGQAATTTTTLEPVRMTARLIEPEPARQEPPSLATLLALGYHRTEADALIHLSEQAAESLKVASAKAKAASPYWSSMAPPALAPAPAPVTPPSPPASPVPNP